jgi:hypothetical protein
LAKNYGKTCDKHYILVQKSNIKLPFFKITIVKKGFIYKYHRGVFKKFKTPEKLNGFIIKIKSKALIDLDKGLGERWSVLSNCLTKTLVIYIKSKFI